MQRIYLQNVLYIYLLFYFHSMCSSPMKASACKSIAGLKSTYPKRELNDPPAG